MLVGETERPRKAFITIKALLWSLFCIGVRFFARRQPTVGRLKGCIGVRFLRADSRP